MGFHVDFRDFSVINYLHLEVFVTKFFFVFFFPKYFIYIYCFQIWASTLISGIFHPVRVLVPTEVL